MTLILFSCSRGPEEPGFRISGRIEGLEKVTVYLDGAGPRDTLITENGAFRFSGSVAQPLVAFIEIAGMGRSRGFYLENSDIELSGHVDSLDFLRVIGSKTEDENQAYQDVLEVFEKEYAEIGREYETADPDRKAQLEKDYEQAELRQAEAQKQFVRRNPGSYLCLGIISEIDWSFQSAAEFEEYLGILDTSLLKLEEANYLIDLAGRMRLVEVGARAPDFVMNDVQGKPNRLADVYPHSELLLLDFWASNCGPCRVENAYIRKAYDLYQGKGLEILGVSTDTRKEHWISAIEQDGLIWKNVCSLESWGDNEVVHTYALRQVSQNFLLDKNGFIIAKDLRGEALITKLGELLH